MGGGGGGGGFKPEIVTWGLPVSGDSDYNSHICQLTINFPGNFARRNLTPEHIFGIIYMLSL